MNRKTMWIISFVIAAVIVTIINIKYWIDDAHLTREEIARIEYYVNNDEYVALNDMEIKSRGHYSELNRVLQSCQDYAIADFTNQSETNYSANLVGMLYSVCVKAITELKGKLN